MDFISSMGFTAGQIAQAMALCDNNSETALELLLSGAIADDEGLPPLPAGSQPMVRQCTISQYSLEGGQSACTVISTMLATEALRALTRPQCNNVSLVELFQDTIQRGVALAVSNDSYQHLSCEEALLLLPAESRLVQRGPVLQGLLDQPGCFADILRRARAAAGSDVLAVVLTKPPESVCVVLSPTTSYLFDSHARPSLGLSCAYVVESPSEQAVLERLVGLFPPFPVDDLDEMQRLMYNGVDATVFTRDACAVTGTPSGELPPKPSSYHGGDWVVVPAPPP
jgi:hypothetical protein